MGVFIVAEMSANHGQHFDKAVMLVRAAKEAGADAIKLQTYTPDTMTIRCSRPEFVIRGGTPWDGETLHGLYEKTYMPWEWQPRLKELADDIGIELFSTPYDKTAVDFLEEIGVARHKIASFEAVDFEFVRYVASKRKPILISAGASSLEEIQKAVENTKQASSVSVLHCVSSYPTSSANTNLRAITTLQKVFRAYGANVGLSDHSLELAVPVAAVALGAAVIEKHLTLSRSDRGPDSGFSLEPHEFASMVKQVRTTEAALGYSGIRAVSRPGREFRRSLFVVQDVLKGEAFMTENVRSIRPGYGLPPEYAATVIGRRATQNIERGTPLSWELVEK